MIISIDFDDTYTKDPELWDMFCLSAIDKGHTVYCVSARPEEHMYKVRNTIGKVIGTRKCFGTSLKCKRDHMKKYGIHIDVWIDDTPDAIVSNHYDTLVMK